MCQPSELVDEMVSIFAEVSRRGDNELERSTFPFLEGCNCLKAWWLPTPNESDKVWSSHFRKVISFNCGMPETFGEAQFIRISITGSSFMVHQVRTLALFLFIHFMFENMLTTDFGWKCSVYQNFEHGIVSVADPQNDRYRYRSFPWAPARRCNSYFTCATFKDSFTAGSSRWPYFSQQ